MLFNFNLPSKKRIYWFLCNKILHLRQGARNLITFYRERQFEYTLFYFKQKYIIMFIHNVYFCTNYNFTRGLRKITMWAA